MSETLPRQTFFSGLLQGVAERGRALVGLKREEALGVEPALKLCDRLIKGRGEASGVAAAAMVLGAYARLAQSEKRTFLSALAERFGPNLAALADAARAFLEAPDDEHAAALGERAEPIRQELIRRLNQAPGGTLALVRMREDAQDALGDDKRLQALDRDFRHLFASWFNRGFLVLRRIDWTTPANILEKIIRYEAVHAIDSWDDLRRRLEPPDRRLYAFFHPALGDEPLIFVEVALTASIPDAIEPLLSGKRAPIDAAQATTAVFYSISNAQRGLAGVSFGNFLIKQVVEDLKRELPKLSTFVTLSPVPGFAAWLRREHAKAPAEAIGVEAGRLLGLAEHDDLIANPAAREAFARRLAPLAAHYFLNARDRSGRIVDSVARFHLGNGARLERLNALADFSKRGLEASLGLMVNYLYDLDQIEANHEAYANRQEIVAAPVIKRLAAAAKGDAARRKSPEGAA